MGLGEPPQRSCSWHSRPNPDEPKSDQRLKPGLTLVPWPQWSLFRLNANETKWARTYILVFKKIVGLSGSVTPGKARTFLPALGTAG